MIGVDVTTGETYRLPPIVGLLSLQTQYRIGPDRQLMLRSPLDNVYYGVGTPTSAGFVDALQIDRAVDIGRAWVESGDRVAVQLTLGDRPTEVAFPDRANNLGAVEIVDSMSNGAGQLIALVAVHSESGWITKLLSVTRGGYHVIDVEFDLGTSMSSYIALDGGVVSVASFERDGLHVRKYEISEAR